MAEGKIRLKKSVNTVDKLVNDRGLSVPSINFADSFIFSEIGNESAFEFDYDDEEWYLDLTKILPSSTSYINIEAPKAGDIITYDPESGKFINNSVFVTELNEIKDKVDNKDNQITVIEKELEILRTFVTGQTTDGATGATGDTGTDGSILTDETPNSAKKISTLPDYSREIEYLKLQIDYLKGLVDIQQTTIQNFRSSGTPTFKYQIIDKEIPKGILNGSNRSYTLEFEPVPGSESVFLNGVMQDSERDYSLVNKHITFVEPPLQDMVIRCSYRVSDDPDATKATKKPILYNLDYGTNPAYVYALIEKEIPIGSIDGNNKTFELEFMPIEGSECVYLNGVLQEPGGENANYNIVGKVITFVEPPLADMVIRCMYKTY
jgi:hypothetical protein